MNLRTRVMINFGIGGLIAAAVILLAAKCAGAAEAECLSSASAVWSAHHGSHAMWSRRVAGHDGEKCYFVQGGQRMSSTKPRLARSAPIPLPRFFHDQSPVTRYAPDIMTEEGRAIAAAVIIDGSTTTPRDQFADKLLEAGRRMLTAQ